MLRGETWCRNYEVRDILGSGGVVAWSCPNVSPSADPIKCSSTWQKTAKRRHLTKWKIPPSVETHMGPKTRQLANLDKCLTTIMRLNSPSVESRKLSKLANCLTTLEWIKTCQLSENPWVNQNLPTVKTRQLYDNSWLTQNPQSVKTRQLYDNPWVTQNSPTVKTRQLSDHLKKAHKSPNGKSRQLSDHPKMAQSRQVENLANCPITPYWLKVA